MPLRLVNFRLRDEEFGLDIGSVREITAVPEMSRIPDGPLCIRGVANLRGRILAVVDLARLFGFPPHDELPETSRIVVTEVRRHTAGILVDEVTGIFTVSGSDVEPASDLLDGGLSKDYIKGVGKLKNRLIILLDLERILAPDELRETVDAGVTR